ncbi:MAG TPA: hypothetical protein DCE44_11810, partial [Verrucomicrobiales bacterium]|nr:hypothetical protein [Verrucomicrobiales bacterium]
VIATNNYAHAAAAIRVQDAAGRAAQFAGQMQADAAAPKVFRQRTYLDTLARSAARSRKIVLGATNTSDVFLFNLEEKIRPDMGDLGLDDPNSPK